MNKSKTNSPRKQKQLGPAPIASFEDSSSDELKFKIDLNKTESQLSDIMEHVSPHKIPSASNTDNNNSLKSMPAMQSRNVLRVSQTPRIDISRASSSSQHEDSRDSSPENVFEQIGTGTLQEGDGNTVDLGFGEDGTNDLRSSTEELYLIEGEDKTKIKVEQEKDWHPTRSSPVLFKFDEKQQACLQQNARKDSVSSEVAALLCISGRTSRISSVGSQGSAVSRLSAVSGVSGVSRSPSPHKMLLETSFCGPKSLNSNVRGALATTGESITADELEQIILARKHDLTKAVFAEGINIDTSTPKNSPIKTNNENGDIKEKLEKVLKKRTQIITGGPLVPCGSVNAKKGGVLKKNNNRTIVGVTPNGTQYIRIKLKPDEQYGTDESSTNEHVVEEAEISKPDTLSLKNSATKKAAPHFTQLVQNDETYNMQNDNHLTPSVSPKPSHNTNIRSTISRSPSPATGISISRKSSFCSLFKAKETASPDSPSGQRKKSAISILLDSPRDRSRSKSRESDKSANSTPSKQRSVLAIFKPRRSSSKSSSPVDPEMMMATNEAMNAKKSGQEHRSRKQSPKPEIGQQRPGSTTPRLRYYDAPDDGNAIYIPLHTPPDEKEGEFAFSSSVITTPSKPSTLTAQIITSAEISEPQPKVKTTQYERQSVKPQITKSIVSTSTTPTAAVQSKATKSYRVELPDGTIRIPLRSPSDEHDTELNDIENESQQWSTVVQLNSSQESQDTVVSSKAPSLISNEIIPNQPIAVSTVVVAQVTPITNPVEQKTEMPKTEASQEEMDTVPVEIANGGIRPMSKERKRILFTMKLGSGSEEQIFATQLSLSKTESLSSQLSEQAPTLDSPATDKNEIMQRDDIKPQFFAQQSHENGIKPLVKVRSKEDNGAEEPEVVHDPKAVKEEKINVNRHSMFIENIEEIMENQKRIEMQRRSSNAKEQQKLQRDGSVELEKSSLRPVKPKRESKSQQSSKSRDSSEGHEIAADGSSGSEQGSEINPKNRMPRQIGIVEEESTGLVSQESYDDELPYVPTTLPEERTLGVAIMPIRDRALMEVKTFPVERPRSTTPLNPSYLEEYCLNDDGIDGSPFMHGEKLRINLPRKDIKDGTTAQKTKSPRRTSNASGKNWFEFAEQGIGGTSNTLLCSPSDSHGKEIQTDCPSVRKSLQNTTAEWIDFENIPEKRKPAKRITTLPHKDQMMGEASHHIQYNYVNPDECQCECHGAERDVGSNKSDSEKKESFIEDQSPDDCVPLLESDPEENLNRNVNVEAVDIGTDQSSEIWCQQSFGAESQDSNKAKKSSFDSGDSESPVLTRSNKTTTVQLPQRLQR